MLRMLKFHELHLRSIEEQIKVQQWTPFELVFRIQYSFIHSFFPSWNDVEFSKFPNLQKQATLKLWFMRNTNGGGGFWRNSLHSFMQQAIYFWQVNTPNFYSQLHVLLSTFSLGFSFYSCKLKFSSRFLCVRFCGCSIIIGICRKKWRRQTFIYNSCPDFFSFVSS